ncbi:hypothetical protein [Candidatus Thiosymbion oneisti]|uniref:hypothetical protein n=1 Tax=Candidatus Thiosymbion oneisti TaxID=589554 RepID=UPI00105F11F9|nr:hypothetical protein [Candidatus Thiosymbion oneisti]
MNLPTCVNQGGNLAVAQFENFMLGRSLSGPFNARTQCAKTQSFFVLSLRPCVFLQFPFFRELSHYRKFVHADP